MGVRVKDGVFFGGSSNSADMIMYDETKNVKKKIDEVEGKIKEYKKVYSVSTPTEVGANATLVSGLDYDFVDVECAYAVSYTTYRKTIRIFKNTSSQASFMTQTGGKDIVYVSRIISYSGGSVIAGDAENHIQGQAGVTNNTLCVPVAIYGGYIS